MVLEGAAYTIPKVNTGDGALLERVYFKTEAWKVRLSNEKILQNLPVLMKKHNFSRH